MPDPKSDPRTNVRVGAFERTLHNFNAEIGQKTAILLNQYHARFVIPLQKRVEWLEKSRWERARIIFGRWWTARAYPWLKARFGPKAAPAAEGEGVTLLLDHGNCEAPPPA